MSPGAPGAIDIVCNPFTPAEVADRRGVVDQQFLAKVGLAPELRHGMPIEWYLEKMDRAGIERSLLIAVRAGDSRGGYSFSVPYERVAGYCQAHPSRFSGLAGIDPMRPSIGLHELERGVRELGFVGAHLYPHWFEKPPDDRLYYPFYAKCCELDVPLMLQVGHCLDYSRGHVLPSVGRPLTLDRVAIDFPELKLIGIHLGWPWTEEMIALCYKHANVYMSGDAYGPRHWPQEFVRFIDSFGQDKVLFGTDWPVIDPERALREIDGLGLRPQPRQKFLRDNALRLFRLAPPPAGSVLKR